jgi:hypothetical protein
MLFIESRTADLSVEKRLRTSMLEALQDRGFVPLIRASRLHFFEQATADAERARDLERAVAERADAEGEEPYVRGDVFCFEDFAHFLIFGEGSGAGVGLRAGVVYDAETDEPMQKPSAATCRKPLIKPLIRPRVRRAARVHRRARVHIQVRTHRQARTVLLLHRRASSGACAKTRHRKSSKVR